MPVVLGVRGQLDRLFSAAGAARTLFAPAGVNFTAQASDVVTIGRNDRTDAVWSLDQWDQGRSFHSTAPDPYLEVHGFKPEHDRLMIRAGKGSYWFHAVETDVDDDGRNDLLLGRYDYDRHGGGDGPGIAGFYDVYAVLHRVSAAELGLTPFAGGRYGESLYWINNMSGAYPSFIQTAWWDPLAAEYEAEVEPPLEINPIPRPEPDPPEPPLGVAPIPRPKPIPKPDGGNDHEHNGGISHDHDGPPDHDHGDGVVGDVITELDPYQRLTNAVARREPITSRSKRRNRLTGTEDLDVIQPWRGRDTVTGLGDVDAVLLVKPAEYGKRRDQVMDFEPGHDHLFLTRRFADYGKRFRFHTTGPELTLQKGKRLTRGFVYDTSTGGLWFNENGRRPGWGIGGLAVQFLGAPAITGADWTVS